MLSFCPEPIEDELLYGLVGRWFIQSGFKSWRKFLIAAFGTRPTLSSREVIVSLALRSAHAEVASTSLAAEQLTVLPFHRPLMKRSTYATFRTAASLKSLASVRVSPITSGATAAKDAYIQFCPFCASEQREKLGFATWLRSHNIPGVDMCLTHRSRLHNRTIPVQCASFFPVPTTGPKRYEYEFPDDDLLYSRRAFQVCTSNHEPIPIGVRHRVWRCAIQAKYGQRRLDKRHSQLLEEDLMKHPKLLQRIWRCTSDPSPIHRLVEAFTKGLDRTESMREAIVLAEVLFEDGVNGFLRDAVMSIGLNETEDEDSLFPAMSSDFSCQVKRQRPRLIQQDTISGHLRFQETLDEFT